MDMRYLLVLTFTNGLKSSIAFITFEEAARVRAEEFTHSAIISMCEILDQKTGKVY